MAERKRRGFWSRLLHNRLSIVGLTLTALLVIAGTFAPFIAPYDPTEMMFSDVFRPPSLAFPFGTDSLGRDMLSRIIWGARTSLYVGVLATAISLLIGVTFGSLAGYFQRTLSPVFMRLADIQLSVPDVVLLIVAATVIGARSLEVIALIIGVTMWPSIGRVARSKVMDIKTRDFVDAARMAGAGHGRIIWRHILPNGVGPLLIVATLDVGSAIVAEAGLSFLGLGDPTAVSWGQMITQGIEDMTYAPWCVIFPGLAIFSAVWGINVLGDALRDTLDVEL
ncbi:ABC transporter permease [Martelella radicis]|uniref:ABC-type dipeptide/oligopeptide/nickel transport system permease subunit n=1 Tax=Martelella radicis TaxID=1397476 RepID=A0A7W6KNT3_9HYPH|nr:ABC transporter permease [Martelella radicis]MBB4124560.1 ABC-type dipeptide/oligopeptide/nickel transport system permease subunit [Martelella radicis]